MNIRPVAGELFHAHVQRKGDDEANSGFRQFWKASKTKELHFYWRQGAHSVILRLTE
jgi:hypothetical protein